MSRYRSRDGPGARPGNEAVEALTDLEQSSGAAAEMQPTTLLAGGRAILSSEFARNVGETYGARLISIAVGAVTTVVIARELGPHGRGLYAIAATIGAIGVALTNLGLQASNTYFVARDRSLLPELLGNTLTMCLMIVPLLAAPVLLGFLLWGGAPVHGALAVLAIVAVPIGLAYMLLQNLLLGLHDIRHYNVIDVVTRVLGLVLLLLVIGLDVVSVAALYVTSVAASAAAAVWALMRLWKLLGERVPAVSRRLFGRTLRYGLRAYVAAFFAFLLLRSDIFLVRYKLGTAEAGIYSVAVSLADLLYVLPTVIGTILFPRLSQMNDERRQWAATVRVCAVVAVVMTVAAAVAWPLARPAISALFGEAFVRAAPAFVILAAAMIFYGVNTIVSIYAASRGFPRLAVYVWPIGVGLNLVLNLVFIPRYGISGSALASLVAYAGVMVVQGAYFVVKESRVARPA